MKSVFQVVAASVLAQATIAYGADAKSTLSNLKKGAAATAADAKAKAAEVTSDAKAQANEAKTSAQDAVKEATKKAEPAPAQSASSAPVTASDVKDAAKEVKEELSKQGDASGLAGTQKSLIIPESAVLPQNVVRFRAIYGSAQSTKGYDANANKIENGLDVKVDAATAVLEYGITDRISAQLLIPYRLDGKAAVASNDNFAKFGIHDLLDAKIKEIRHALGAGYTANAPAPADIVLVPAFASLTTIKAGIPIKTAADQIANALKDIANNPTLPQYQQLAAGLLSFAKTEVENQKFQKGLGDIEIGAKYSLSTVKEPWFNGVPLYTSVAAGVRLNSSNYSEATKKGEKPVGRGTMDGAIRLNVDYEVINGVQLQLENQSEFMLAKGKAWNYAEANKGKEHDLERNGSRQLGYSKLVIAPGTWVPAVEFLMLNARYGWNNDSETKLDDVVTAGTVGRSAQLGLSFDGLKMKLPVQLDYDYVMAARSRNVSSAFDAHVATLKLFYKF